MERTDRQSAKGFLHLPLEEAVLGFPAGEPSQAAVKSPDARAEPPTLFSKSQLKSLETSLSFLAQKALSVYGTKLYPKAFSGEKRSPTTVQKCKLSLYANYVLNSWIQTQQWKTIIYYLR